MIHCLSTRSDFKTRCSSSQGDAADRTALATAKQPDCGGLSSPRLAKDPQATATTSHAKQLHMAGSTSYKPSPTPHKPSGLKRRAVQQAIHAGGRRQDKGPGGPQTRAKRHTSHRSAHTHPLALVLSSRLKAAVNPAKKKSASNGRWDSTTHTPWYTAAQLQQRRRQNYVPNAAHAH